MSLRLFEAVMFSQNVFIFGDFSSFENTNQAVCRLSLNLSVSNVFPMVSLGRKTSKIKFPSDHILSTWPIRVHADFELQLSTFLVLLLTVFGILTSRCTWLAYVTGFDFTVLILHLSTSLFFICSKSFVFFLHLWYFLHRHTGHLQRQLCFFLPNPGFLMICLVLFHWPGLPLWFWTVVVREAILTFF